MMSNTTSSPFWIMVSKEISDHVKSWRFIILGILMLLTCMGALYTAINNLPEAIQSKDSSGDFLFLKLFTLSDESLPAFHIFISFLGPILGISLGFDAINSEINNRTLGRIIAQPIHRDHIINSKFLASLIVISAMLFTLIFLVIGIGLLIIGIPFSLSEFLRIVSFWLISILYIAFWLSLSIFFSVKFKQAATSALTSLSIWLFFSVFYPMIINLIQHILLPNPNFASPGQLIHTQKITSNLFRIMPSQLFSDATTTLLLPSVRSLGPLTPAQTIGAIPSPLPLGQSILLVWPQLIGLLAATIICFAISYILFMKKEIRSN